MSYLSYSDFKFFSLTPEEDDDNILNSKKEENYTWVDDSECQENLFQIISLTPEVTTIDKDNHIITTFYYFFEELGYLTEEPEPIDPSRDYDEEARIFLEKRNKTHKRHINISTCLNSIDHTIPSTNSSFNNHLLSPHYIGLPFSTDHTKQNNLPYHYSNYKPLSTFHYYH